MQISVRSRRFLAPFALVGVVLGSCEFSNISAHVV